MALLRLVFESTLTNVTEATLATALYTGRRNNRANLITGVVLCAGRNVIEVLEGQEHVVRATFERIRKDPRLQVDRILEEQSIDRRYFTQWNAGFRKPGGARGPTQYDLYVFDGVDATLARRIPDQVLGHLFRFSERIS